MNKTISIIIPTFNRAHILSNTLDSISNQSFKNWECLVIDDGSTDDTEKLMDKYVREDYRFKFLKRPEDRPKGANACRNYGLDKCGGKYINFFDSDDIMKPEKLESQFDILEKKRDIPYVICQTQWIDLNTNTDLGLRSKAISSENPFEDYILYKIFWSILAPLWRKEFIDKNNLRFDEILHQSQEYDFHIKALAVNSNYACIDEPLVAMYKHDSNISNNIYSEPAKVRSNLKVKSRVLHKYSKQLSEEGKIKYFEMMTLVYKQVLQIRNYQTSFFALKQLFKNIKYVKASLFRKGLFLLKTVLAYLSFRLIGRGYNMIKPLS